MKYRIEIEIDCGDLLVDFNNPEEREWLEQHVLKDDLILVSNLIGDAVAKVKVVNIKKDEKGELIMVNNDGMMSRGSMSGEKMTTAKSPQMEKKKIDPWGGRSIKMKCRTCIYSAPKLSSNPTTLSPVVGRCRRHAPTMKGFPVIFLDEDWCGDHKLNEEAI